MSKTTERQANWSILGVLIAAVVISSYVILTWARLPASWSQSLHRMSSSTQTQLLRLVGRGCETLGIENPALELRHGIYLLLTGLVLPWVVAAILLRGNPADIGLRRPNRLGWRILAVSYVIALPLVVWMALSPKFGPYYLPQIARSGAAVFLTYHFFGMLAEHFLFHGVMLAAFRKGGRWPAPPPVDASARSASGRLLQWFGLAQPTDGAFGVRRVTRWIGLPDGCVVALLVSAALFGVIHIGKDPRELLMSFPGGIGLAYLAYRTNSWLIPFLLHLVTAGTACLLMVLLASG